MYVIYIYIYKTQCKFIGNYVIERLKLLDKDKYAISWEADMNEVNEYICICMYTKAFIYL